MKSTRYQGGVELLNSSLKRENSKSTTRLVVKKKSGENQKNKSTSPNQITKKNAKNNK